MKIAFAYLIFSIALVTLASANEIEAAKEREQIAKDKIVHYCTSKDPFDQGICIEQRKILKRIQDFLRQAKQ